MEHDDAHVRRGSADVKAAPSVDAAPAAGRPASARDVLRLRDFRLLWLGQLASNVGDGLTNFALLIVIQRLTGSIAAVATMSLVLAIPQIVLGLFAGVFVDRWDRRRTMIVTDVLRGLVVLGFLTVRDADHVWVFYAVGFAQATLGTFFGPARTAFVSQIVPREGLVAANSFVQTTRFLTMVVGEGLAGVLVGAAGGAWLAFSVDALTFGLSALLLACIAARPPLAPPSPPAPGDAAPGSVVARTFAQLLEGLRIIAAERVLLCAIATIAATTLGVAAVLVLAVPYLVQVQGVRTELLGVMGGAEVLGMILGTGLLAVFSSRVQPRVVVVVGVAVVGLMLAVVARAPNMTWVLSATFVIGLVAAPVDACVDTLVQSLVPPEARGRVSSAMNTLFSLASLASMGAAGLLGDRIGLRNVFLAAGAITFLAGVGVAPFMLAPGARERPQAS